MIAPSDLSTLERAVLEKSLAGDHPVVAGLRDQLQTCRVVARQMTETGFCTTLCVDPAVPPVTDRSFTLDDVAGDVEGVAHGMGFVVYVTEGRLDAVEGFTYEEPWPGDVTQFTLFFERGERDLSHL